MLESSGGYAKTPNAFIFSLNNFERVAPFLSKVKTGKTGSAIFRGSTVGPKFGSDLVIYLNANKMKYSRAVLGWSYSVPDSVEDKGKVLKGPGPHFSPDEVEVFYLDPSH